MKRKVQMKIKFNWGTGIVIVTAVFMVISVSTTLFFMNQDVDLVDKNYYEKELAYQQQVSKLQKTADMKADIDFSVEKNAFVLAFPKEHLKENITGEIFLYRAASSKKDYTIPVAMDSSGVQFINTSKMNRGLWKIQVSWSSGENEFYSEKNLMVF